MSQVGALAANFESGLPLVTWTMRRPDGVVLLVGVARLRHAPSELVIVVAERFGERHKVVSINSVVVK